MNTITEVHTGYAYDPAFLSHTLKGHPENASRLCDGRLVVILEGGYDLEVLKYGVYNIFKVMQNASGAALDPLGLFDGTETPVSSVIRQITQIHGLS